MSPVPGWSLAVAPSGDAAAGRGGVGYVRAVTAHCVRRGRIGPRDGLGCPQRMCGGSMRYREQHFVLSHSVA